MSTFSKIVVIIIIVLSFFYVKEKFFNDVKLMSEINKLFNKKTVEPETNPDKQPNVVQQPEEKVSKTAYVYFLALDSEGGSVFKRVERQYNDDDKLTYAVKELLKGPNLKEKSFGAYNEIPKGTKLIGIEKQGNNVIVNLSSDFQYGGGTDSIYSRLRQLIKTILANSDGKNVYLYMDGKQANVIGGEGIMVSQPLSENSLDD